MKIFNKILSILLITFFLVITGQNTIAYLYFKVNQNYIAKNICVQKDVKNNYCLGNCYLKAIQKRLAQNEENQNNNATPVKYNSSNPIQEYIVSNLIKFTKIESVTVFKNNKIYRLLEKDRVPLTPPPKFLNLI
jgi:hypothetical protein